MPKDVLRRRPGQHQKHCRTIASAMRWFAKQEWFSRRTELWFKEKWGEWFWDNYTVHTWAYKLCYAEHGKPFFFCSIWTLTSSTSWIHAKHVKHLYPIRPSNRFRAMISLTRDGQSWAQTHFITQAMITSSLSTTWQTFGRLTISSGIRVHHL